MDTEDRQISAHLRPVPTYIIEREQYLNSASGPEDQLTHEASPLQDYFKIFLSYRWLICSVSFIVLVCAALYSFLATPMYTAEAKLKIGTYSPLLPAANMEDILRQQTKEQDYLQTQIELLTSLSLADKVLTESGIEQELKGYFGRKTSFFSILEPLKALFSPGTKKQKALSSDYHHPLESLQSYLRLLGIVPVRKTSLVKVSVTTADPELSAKIANAHSQAFIDYIRAERQQSALENLVFLKGQAEELANKVALAERNIAAYAEENAIVSLNKDENIVVRRMAELNDLLTRATAKRIESESAIREAESGSGIGSTSLDDQSIEQLRTTLKETQSEYAMLAEKFKPTYPRMVQLKARIDSLQKNLSEQREQAVSGLRAKYKADLDSEEQLKKQLEVQKSQAFELSRREVQYNIMKREYESLKDLHQSVIRQLKESQIAAESQGTNITLSDKAAVPLSHSSPRRSLNMLIALIFGPMLGFGLALALEALDNTFKTPEELQNYLQLPSLGVVPSFALEHPSTVNSSKSEQLQLLETSSDENQDEDSASSKENQSRELSLPANGSTPNTTPAPDFVTLTAPRSIESESFRAIRTGILLSSADNPPKTVLFTSGKKGEGKTTLTTNLGITLAQTGKRTIIIDADLRRPSIHKLFPFASSAGIVEYLTGQAQLEEVIQRLTLENLHIICAGAQPPNPAELVGSRKMAELIQELSQHYDYVLVDAPPILPVTDSVVLSRIVDGVVMVVRGQDTQKQAVRDAVAKLRQVGAKILGVVLNDVNVRSGHYYYYYRDAYSDYYGEDGKRRSRRKTASA